MLKVLLLHVDGLQSVCRQRICLSLQVWLHWNCTCVTHVDVTRQLKCPSWRVARDRARPLALVRCDSTPESKLPFIRTGAIGPATSCMSISPPLGTACILRVYMCVTCCSSVATAVHNRCQHSNKATICAPALQPWPLQLSRTHDPNTLFFRS